MMPTRRMWMRQVGAVAAAANTCIARLFGAPARTLEVDRLLDRYRNARWEQERTQYRVDAALMMFTSPVHSFGGIGHGFLALGETAGATYVRFGAASSPENAHGFDRAGFIEEASAADEFASFGFITAGHNSESGSIAGGGFTAMDQYLKHRECWFRGAGVPVALADRLHLDKLIGFIRGALPETGGVHRQVELNGAYPSFLHAVLRAVSAKDTRFHCVYVYNAKQFDLSVERHEDSRMAALLEDKGLTRRRDAIRRYEGTIRDQPGQSSGRQWSFRFWREDGTSNRLPLRIEFQPRPFLRLCLEPSLADVSNT